MKRIYKRNALGQFAKGGQIRKAPPGTGGGSEAILTSKLLASDVATTKAAFTGTKSSMRGSSKSSSTKGSGTARIDLHVPSEMTSKAQVKSIYSKRKR